MRPGYNQVKKKKNLTVNLEEEEGETTDIVKCRVISWNDASRLIGINKTN
jgi:hypothetical protein